VSATGGLDHGLLGQSEAPVITGTGVLRNTGLVASTRRFRSPQWAGFCVQRSALGPRRPRSGTYTDSMVDWGRHQESAARKQAASEAAQRQREAHQAEALDEERRRLQAQFAPWSDYIDDFMAKAERSRWSGADRRRSGVFSSTIHEYACRIGNDSLMLRSDGSWGFERRHRAEAPGRR